MIYSSVVHPCQPRDSFVALGRSGHLDGDKLAEPQQLGTDDEEDQSPM